MLDLATGVTEQLIILMHAGVFPIDGGAKSHHPTFNDTPCASRYGSNDSKPLFENCSMAGHRVGGV